MRLMGRAKMVAWDHDLLLGITRAPSISENGGGRVGAVVVDIGSNQHQALQHAERKARTYGKALLGLAGLLCH